MDAAQRQSKLPHHLGERGRKRGPPADKNVIVAWTQSAGAGCRRHAHDLAQSAAHTVALYGVADLARHGKADADGPLIAARARLQGESGARGPHATRSGLKIAPALKPLDDHGTGVAIRH